MSQTLRISDTLSLPIDAVTQTDAIIARKGRGKTYTACVMAEELCRLKQPWVAIDPTGVWWGLRSSADGEHPGYQVVIIGGQHGDIPLDPSKGAAVADMVTDYPGHYILDLSDIDDEEQQDKFCLDFATRLYRAKAKKSFPMKVYVDEADTVVPQQPASKLQFKMLRAFDILARRGRTRGLGMCFITQRPAVVHKNVLSQAECLIVLQIISEADREVVQRWVKAHDVEKQAGEFMESLASLRLGEAWVWSPTWLQIFKRVQIRQRETFNSSKTPEVGQQQEAHVLAKIDLDLLRSAVGSAMQKAQANDPVFLQERIRVLENQLVARPVAVKVQERVVEKIVEKPYIPAGVHEDIAEIQGLMAETDKRIENLKTSMLMPVKPLGTSKQAERPLAVLIEPLKEGVVDAEVPLPARGEARLIQVLSQAHPHPLPRQHLATLACLKPEGSTFVTYLSRLRRADKVFEQSGRIGLTSGFDLGQYGAIDRPAIIEEWKGKLREGARNMLGVVVEKTDGVHKSELGAIVGISPTGSTFSTYLSVLRRNGLITVDGQMVKLGEALR